MTQPVRRKYGVREFTLNAAFVIGVPALGVLVMNFSGGRGVGMSDAIRPALEGTWVLESSHGLPQDAAPERLRVWAKPGADHAGFLEANGRRVELVVNGSGSMQVTGEHRLDVLPMLEDRPDVHVMTHNYPLGRWLDRITLCSGYMAQGGALDDQVNATYVRE